MELAHSPLHCCRIWRSIMLERFCSEITLDINIGRERSGLRFMFWPQTVGAPHFATNHLVKAVRVKMHNWQRALDARLLQMIMVSGQSTLVFPHAETLTVDLTEGMDCKSNDIELGKRDVIKLIKAIRKMVPDMCKTLCADLCKGVGQVCIETVVDAYSLVVKPQRLACVTSIKHDGHDADALGFESIRQNASTLRSLELFNRFDDHAGNLVYTSPAGAIVYPVLEKLSTFGYQMSPQFLEIPELSQVVLFSKLKYLRTPYEFYHSNNYMLRGNSSTLEYLSIYIHERLVAKPKDSRTFKPNTYLRLSHIRLISTVSLVTNSIWANKGTEFTLGVIKAVKSLIHSLELFENHPKNVFIYSLDRDKWTSNIRFLNVEYIDFNFIQLTDLLKTLPVLQMLRRGLCSPRKVFYEDD
ncbi:hypothetical protein GGF37_002906 [Kickxella alabastrina]|nr:hypothetical protein GGF37_002906 [Kickxella alabastrina]